MKSKSKKEKTSAWKQRKIKANINERRVNSINNIYKKKISSININKFEQRQKQREIFTAIHFVFNLEKQIYLIGLNNTQFFYCSYYNSRKREREKERVSEWVSERGKIKKKKHTEWTKKKNNQKICGWVLPYRYHTLINCTIKWIVRRFEWHETEWEYNDNLP